MRRSESWKKQWITFQAEGPAICKVSNSRMSLACFRNREATVAGVSLMRGREPAGEMEEGAGATGLRTLLPVLWETDTRKLT